MDIEQDQQIESSDFSPEERQLFLKEMGAAARDHRGVLGPATGMDSDQASERVQSLMDELGKEVARFSPTLDVRRITKQNFADRKMKVPLGLSDLMHRFDFFMVNIPITLVPRAGWSFNKLECRVQFNRDEPPAQRPVAHEIFPKELWQDLIKAHQSLEIGLDESLKFKADPSELLGEQALAGLPFKAAVTLKAEGKAGFVAGPFSYVVRRPKIISRGQGDVEVVWRLLGGDTAGHEEPKLSIVLKVPKKVRHVNVVGAMWAGRDFDILSAGIRELLEFVKERTAQFFRAGAPATDGRTWVDVTAGL